MNYTKAISQKSKSNFVSRRKFIKSVAIVQSITLFGLSGKMTLVIFGALLVVFTFPATWQL